MRIHLEEERAFLPIKGTPQRQTHAEFAYPILIADATQIIEKLCIKPLILKTRHKIQAGKLTWEIDAFAITGASSIACWRNRLATYLIAIYIASI